METLRKKKKRCSGVCQLGRFEIKGAIIRIYGKVEAFTNGDLVNPRVAHIFFEKANPNIRGLYQAINRDFLMHEFAETEFVNREEDMGLPGLRQAKWNTILTISRKSMMSS